MPPLLPSVLLAFSPLVVAPGAPDDFVVTAELLREITDVALPELKKETGALFAEGARVRLATAADIEDALRVEIRPQMALQFDDEGVIEAQTKAVAAGLAPALMAKFRFADRTVLVSEEGFARLAALLDRPEIASKTTLRGVLLHELVHAADEERYAFSKTLLASATTDALQAFNCVIEGHAQLVARRLAARLGWTEGFDTYTRAIGALPSEEELEEMGPAMETILRLQVASFATAYYQGEEFLRAVEAEGGAAAVAHAFRAPPAETAVIFEPRWYFHPEERPARAFDLAVSLDAIGEDYPEPRWARVKIAPTPDQLGVALRSLPPEITARVQRSLLQALVLSLVDQPSGGQTAAAVSLLEFRSPADALFYLEAHRSLQRRSDEDMKKGTIKITSSAYEDLEDPPGLATRKTVEVMKTELEVRAVCLVRGSLVAELVCTETGITAEGARALALRALDGAVVRVAPRDSPPAGAEPGGEKKDG